MNEILITSSVLIAALLLLRRLFRRTLSRRVQYALWGLVLARLLLPVPMPASPFSVLTTVQPYQMRMQEALERRPAPVGAVGAAAAAPVQDKRDPIPAAPGAQDAPSAAAPSSGGFPPAGELLLLLGRAGTVLVAAFFLAVNLSFWRWIRRHRIPYPVEGFPRRVFLVPEGLPSPCLFGLLRPAVYLTPGAVSSPKRLSHVLAHEQTHARHLDPLWSLLRCVCLAVYWFDPLVWIASAAAKTDCELACDEGTLARLGKAERIPYGETLVALIPSKGAPGNLLLTATTMAAGKKQLKDRIVRIAHRPRQLAAAAVAAVLLAGTVGACTFTGASPTPTPDTGILTDWGEPEAVLSLASVPLYTPEPLSIEVKTGWNERVEIYAEGAGPYAIYELRSDEDPTVYFAVADTTQEQREYRCFLALTDFIGGGGWDDDSLFGSAGPVQMITYVDESGQTVSDYVYVTEDGEPVRLAQAVSGMSDTFHMDCNGDGIMELVAPEQLFFQREDGVYLADLPALWAAAYPDYYWDWIRWDPGTGMLEATGFVTDQDGVFRSWRRYLGFDGENLLVYQDPRTVEDHVMSDIDVPQAVVDKAKELTQAWMPQPGDMLGAYGNGDPILATAQYDDWRVERITGPTEIQVGGIVLRVYRFNYEYHTTTPTEVLLVGGMYITEDDWVMPGYPNCDFLFFRLEEDESLTFLWHEMSNDTGPEELAQQGLERLGLLENDPVFLVQGLWTELTTQTEVTTLNLETKDGEGGGAYTTDISWGYNIPWDITRDFRWELLEDVEPAMLAESDVLTVSRGEQSLTFYRESRLVEYQRDGEHRWFRAAQSATDNPFAAELFDTIRMLYDEIELDTLQTGIVIPDTGQSREEAARAWVEQFEGAHLRATSGSKCKYSYLSVLQVKEDTELSREYYPAGIGDEEAFLFWYGIVFVPENQYALNWSMAGNTEEYQGADAPENAYQYGRCGYLYRTEDGWRCDGVGTGP